MRSNLHVPDDAVLDSMSDMYADKTENGKI